MKPRLCAIPLLFLTTVLACRVSLAAPLDDSTPKAAAKALWTALDTGDLTTARQLAMVASEYEDAFNTLVDYSASFSRLSRTVEAKFGKVQAEQFPSPGKKAAGVDATTEKLTGDTATLTSADGKDILRLKNFDGHWKVDIFAAGSFKDPAAAVHELRALADAANKTADDASAGQYKTVNDLQKSLIERVQQAMAAPTTSPANQ